RRLRPGFLGDVNNRETQIIHRAILVRRGRRARRLSCAPLINVSCNPVKLLRAHDKIDMRQIFQPRLAARLGHTSEELAHDAAPTRSPPRAYPLVINTIIRSNSQRAMSEDIPAIGVIGGSGLYQMEEVQDVTEHQINTPFGSPSDTLVGGTLSGRQVYFLPRHGRGHRILPHEINHRANIYALRLLNVRWIISVAAVGSLQEKYAPRDVVLPS